jgi:hypothetical protein
MSVPMPTPRVDPALREAWNQVAPTTGLLGLAGAVSSGRSAAVVVTSGTLLESETTALATALGRALGTDAAAELVALEGAGGDPLENLRSWARQWVNQAAQGSGRGVSTRVEDPPAQGPVVIRVRAIDSSARELAHRLASPHEPALPALRALLGRQVEVVDDEG